MNSAFALSSRPTCPSVLIPFESQLYALPVQKLDISAEFNVSTAFVKITGYWKNIANYASDCLFVLPLNGTVTSVNIKIGKRLFETVIIPKEDAERIKNEQDAKDAKDGKAKPDAKVDAKIDSPASGNGGASGAPPPPGVGFEEYIPNLFRLPIPSVNSADMIQVSVVYLEPLYFSDGQYHFHLPLTFGSNILPPKTALKDVLKIKCIINSVTQQTKYESKTHTLKATTAVFPRIELDVSPTPPSITAAVAAAATSAAAAAAAQQQNRDDKSAPAPSAVAVPGPSSAVAGGGVSAPAAAAAAAAANIDVQASVDFNLSYSMQSQQILPTLIKEDKEDGTGTFNLFVTPPSLENVDAFFSRNMIFLLDRSGSMTGEPYAEASRALKSALSILRPGDQFTIITFDHRMELFNAGLVAASPENIAAAGKWIDLYEPEKGGTNILGPMEYALRLLSSEKKRQPLLPPTAANEGKLAANRSLVLPFVVIVTDGCVEDERKICAYTKQFCDDARVLTFGIGSYCNWFFLKMLSQIGRGFSDVVIYKERIYSQIVQLLNMAATPILTNVTLEMTGLTNVELYPFPIPDLFMGAPLTIAGHYTGKFPATIKLGGVLPDGRVFELTVPSRTSDVIPVSKVFLKQRLDLLTARAWLDQDKTIQQQVVDLSCAESMPSAYTTMIAFETTAEKKDQLLDPLLSKDGTTLEKEERKRRAIQKWYKDPKTIAAIAVGNAVLVGAAVFSFGNLAASASNIPVAGLLSGGLGLLESGCCNVCSLCGALAHCDCGACLMC